MSFKRHPLYYGKALEKSTAGALRKAHRWSQVSQALGGIMPLTTERRRRKQEKGVPKLSNTNNKNKQKRTRHHYKNRTSTIILLQTAPVYVAAQT